jgi:hypothetical protein
LDKVDNELKLQGRAVRRAGSGRKTI